ncbi:spermatogenic leucine zipper protein 1 [Fukomys damarensis]|uniref:spermatogenic leucine zipper protein 1 n=1 Tax=Fukomys damarensis TaxID=885580 RepID=UPI00053F54A0|nr:spermatogenic leucine zipper protein 1 [Fukomys damarensis]
MNTPSAPCPLGFSFSSPVPKDKPLSFVGSPRSMASSDSSGETAPVSHTPSPVPDPHHEALGPGLTATMLEIHSPSPSCWGSPPSPKITRHVPGPLSTQKLQDLLRDLRDVLRSVAGFGGVAEAKESSEESNISKDESEHQEKAGGLDKANEVVSENLLICLDLEEKQGLILENQNPTNTGHLSARDWERHSEGKRTFTRAQLSKKEGARVPGVQEENAKLRESMEQLLQEAEHWSQQHTELSELMRSYQQSHRDSQAQLRSQPHSRMPTQGTLEEAVRRLSQDTHALHLIAALLENECQILQHRVQILKESYQPREGTSPERPPQRNHLQAKNSQDPPPPEAESVECSRQSLPCLGGVFQKKETVYRSSDPCLNRKALNNRLNSRFARALMGRKRPASGFR